MIYYSYYLEIKNRFLLLILSWLSVSFICYLYKESLIFEIIDITGYAGFSKNNPYFVFSNVTDVFSVSFTLIFFISNQVFFLFFLYHLLVFLAPGLYLKELNNLITVFKVSFFCWGFSIFVLNYILFPFSWLFFLSFQTDTDLNFVSIFFEANFKEYFSYYVSLYYLCVLNFQISCLLLFVINSLNNKLNKVSSFRKVFYFIFVTFSTIITPPDLFSQLLLSCCFIILYEFLTFFKILDKTIH